MVRQWWVLTTILLFLVFAAFGPVRAQEGEDEETEWDSLELYFFSDTENVKIKIIEVPSGNVLEEETEKIEDVIGEQGLLVAKKFPKTWIALGPITMTSDEPAATPDMQYYLKFFKLEYAGSVKVKVPESEIYTPETDEPEPDSTLGLPHPIEDWGSGDPDDHNGDNDSDGDVEDDPDEPQGPAVPDIDAFLHIYKYKGKK